jgi:GT2 family glycosyltransferase
MDAADAVPMTVVIPTRNRGDRVVKAVKTILRNDYCCVDLRIVDQSDDDLTEESVRPLLADSRITYVRSTTKGISAALNVGIGDAQTEFIGITGDDCDVPENWLRELLHAFTLDRRIGIVFGNVLPCPHEPRAAFVPAYVRDNTFLARSIYEKHRLGGTSACMGIRRSMWQALAGFDAMLGVGASLKAAEDTDLVIRALLSGYFICETPRVMVTHHGLYEREQRDTVLHNYWYGTGAALVKPLKRGHWSIVLVLLHLAWDWLFGSSRIAASIGDHPHRLSRLAAFVSGFAAGALTPLDRVTGHYSRDRNDEHPPSDFRCKRGMSTDSSCERHGSSESK